MSQSFGDGLFEDDEEDAVPDKLNDFVANSKGVQREIAHKLRADDLIVIVKAKREPISNAAQYPLNLKQYTVKDIMEDAPNRVLHALKTVVVAEANYAAYNSKEWDILLKKKKFNYSSSCYFSSRYVTKNISDGNLLKWLSLYDIEHQSAHILMENLTKTKQQLRASAEEEKQTNTNKARAGRSAAEKNANEIHFKREWLGQFNNYLNEKLPATKPIIDHIAVNPGIAWNCAQTACFNRTSYTYLDAVRFIQTRIPVEQQTRNNVQLPAPMMPQQQHTNSAEHLQAIQHQKHYANSVQTETTLLQHNEAIRTQKRSEKPSVFTAPIPRHKLNCNAKHLKLEDLQPAVSTTTDRFQGFDPVQMLQTDVNAMKRALAEQQNTIEEQAKLIQSLIWNQTLLRVSVNSMGQHNAFKEITDRTHELYDNQSHDQNVIELLRMQRQRPIAQKATENTNTASNSLVADAIELLSDSEEADGTKPDIHVVHVDVKPPSIKKRKVDMKLPSKPPPPRDPPKSDRHCIHDISEEGIYDETVSRLQFEHRMDKLQGREIQLNVVKDEQIQPFSISQRSRPVQMPSIENIKGRAMK